MPQFLCSFPNDPHAPGRRPHLVTDDPIAMAAFVERWDVAERSVYKCVNPLKPGSDRRCIENIERIERIIADIDFRGLAVTAHDVIAALKALPLALTLVVDSGGGLHIYLELKSPFTPSTLSTLPAPAR